MFWNLKALVYSYGTINEKYHIMTFYLMNKISYFYFGKKTKGLLNIL